MNATDLIVYREKFGKFEEVGRIFSSNEGLRFIYSEKYLTSSAPQPISRVFPLQRKEFGSSFTRSFFDGILPEGSVRRALSGAFHANFDDTKTLLSRLNEETEPKPLRRQDVSVFSLSF